MNWRVNPGNLFKIDEYNIIHFHVLPKMSRFTRFSGVYLKKIGNLARLNHRTNSTSKGLGPRLSISKLQCHHTCNLNHLTFKMSVTCGRGQCPQLQPSLFGMASILSEVRQVAQEGSQGKVLRGFPDPSPSSCVQASMR